MLGAVLVTMLAATLVLTRFDTRRPDKAIIAADVVTVCDVVVKGAGQQWNEYVCEDGGTVRLRTRFRTRTLPFFHFGGGTETLTLRELPHH